MGLVVVGISHKTADVDIRERFSFTQDGLKESLLELKGLGAAGAIILSTCNRQD